MNLAKAHQNNGEGKSGYVQENTTLLFTPDYLVTLRFLSLVLHHHCLQIDMEKFIENKQVYKDILTV